MRTSSSLQAQKGFTLIELLVVISIIALLIGILLPALGAARRTARQMQNNTQLRGIQQGMLIFAGSNKAGGQDGFYPGLTSRGRGVNDDAANQIEGAAGGTPGEFGQSNDIEGWDDNDDGDITWVAGGGGEMNASTAGGGVGTGFLQYAFAQLLVADTIPQGSSEYYINPADSDKTRFVAGETTGTAGEFDMGKVSYTTCDVSVNTYEREWGETINTQAIVLGDRAVGNGDEFGGTGTDLPSSVWTDEDSGDWRGGLTRGDGSTETQTTFSAENAGLKYGNVVFEEGDIDNLFAARSGETLNLVNGQIDKTEGVMYDEDEGAEAKGI